MADYRRAWVPGGAYFFTVVTHQRQPIFMSQSSVSTLREGFRRELARRPFTIDALVILPDHLHTIWRLPEGDADFAARWREIKKFATKQLCEEVNGPVWQPRFWEHSLRDQRDWRMHMDYLHFNPVKHGLVEQPADWPWSSFNTCVKRGWYSPTWGGVDVTPGVHAMNLE